MERERRGSLRTPVALSGILNYRTTAVICTIRNLSLNGAFLEADPYDLPYSGEVELGLTIDANGENKYLRLPATIARVTDEGAGISFADVGRDAYFSLVDLVYR